ncbi:MAG: flagellar protein FliT [Gammaproteobacteria bacterium]|nr:MAG: flagellar protein FliT [Gammaproteobacteria bacterium]
MCVKSTQRRWHLKKLTSTKIKTAQELLSLTLEIEAHLLKSDIAFAKDNEAKRMELAKQVFSTPVSEDEAQEIHKIITEVLEINSRLQQFASDAKDEVAKLSKQIKQSRKVTNAYEAHK